MAQGQCWRALSLVSLLLVVSLAVPQTMAHPYHLQIENAIVDKKDGVRADLWRAQSFLPSSDFTVTRVSIYAQDRGASDNLTVGIRLDQGGFPDSATLTSGTVDGPPTEGWLDVDMSPFVTLTSGQAYWIVAHCELGGGAGYDWWDSTDDLSYPDGTGAESVNDTVWIGMGKDYSFRVYGYVDPSFSLSIQVSNATLQPAQSTVFRVTFDNIGLGSAPVLWVNVSLPAELSYVADDAAAIGGVRSGAYVFEFTNVTQGTYSFNLTAEANGGIVDGSTAMTSFTLNATDHAGGPLPQLAGGAAVNLENARLAVSIDSSVAVVEPEDPITYNATITNEGSAVAQNLAIEGSVDPNATYSYSTPSTTYDSVARVVRWLVPSLNPGETTNVEWVVAVAPGTPDVATVTSNVIVDYEDATGTSMPNEWASTVATVQAPSISPVLLLDRALAEHEEEVLATLFYNNTGSRPASGVWANWSLGGHYELMSLVPATVYTETFGGFSVEWADVGPGPHFLVARLRVLQSLADGLEMELLVDLAATDSKGNPLQDLDVAASAELTAPTGDLTLVTQKGRVVTGEVFTLDLSIRNLGRAEGKGWLSIVLPPGVTYVSDTGTFAMSSISGIQTWTIPTMPEGYVEDLKVTLRRGGDPGIESFRFALSLTDETGSPSASVFSNAVSVEFVSAESMAWGWLLLPLAVGLAASASFLMWRRRSSDLLLEDVFVANLAGLLIAHRSASIVPYNDEDLVAAMFLAIQEFVRDSFSRGVDEDIRSLEFGSRKILLERGQTHYVAAVFQGKDTGELEERIRELSEQIDDDFGDAIENWDGSTDTLQAIYNLLPALWKSDWRESSP